MIKFENVSISYGRDYIFTNLDFTIADGEKVAITGKSGCGKTTVLNMIMGMQLPSEGVVSTDGRISAVFQEDRLFSSFDLLENVMSVCDDEKIAKDSLSAVCLSEDCFHMMPHELSGGMARRAAIARALAFKHDILLLDEPFNGIDDRTKEKIIKNILLCEHGTVILISHNADECRMLTDRVIEL